MYSYKKLINVLAGKEEHITDDDRPTFECLFDFLSGRSDVQNRSKNMLLIFPMYFKY